jgi:hypothetical protein
MKTISLKNSIAILFLLAVTTFAGCKKESDIRETSEVNSNMRVDLVSANSGINCIDLIAGQNIVAGSVCIYDVDTDNDGCPDALEIIITTTGGWEIMEAHLAIANTVAGIPTNNGGNPVPGQFPYHSGSLGGVTTYTFNIPFSAIDFTCGAGCIGDVQKYVALHAAVRKLLPGGGYQTETGWGDGDRLKQKGNWGMYFRMWITCDDVEKENTDCNTAFAKASSGSTCFIGNVAGLDANRWGWFNGPLSPGIYTMDLYAGAGQCNISNGTLAGSVTVDYNGSSATVTYNAIGNFSFSEIHAWAGTTTTPLHNGTPTVAPGQLGYNSGVLADVTSHSFTISGLSGDIYFIGHAVACEVTN